MKPVPFFSMLILVGLAALAVWFWINRESVSSEVELTMEPRPLAIPQEPAVPDVAEAVEPKPVQPALPAQPRPAPEPIVPQVQPAIFSDADCRWLTRHIPDADVAYKPGVDVRGNPVVPADLNGGMAFELPGSIEASVSRRLLGHPNLRQETGFATIEIEVATGNIRLNGKSLLPPEQERLIAWCQERS